MTANDIWTDAQAGHKAELAAAAAEKWLVVCDECDGAGEWDEGPLNTSSHNGSADPEYRQVICGKCDGTGKAEEEVEPITMEDLP